MGLEVVRLRLLEGWLENNSNGCELIAVQTVC